jgi:hypothetical protein
VPLGGFLEGFEEGEEAGDAQEFTDVQDVGDGQVAAEREGRVDVVEEEAE